VLVTIVVTFAFLFWPLRWVGLWLFTAADARERKP
jgi:hypothetical protein